MYVILLTRRKATEAPIQGQAITPTCFRKCQDIAVSFKFNKDTGITEIENCLPRSLGTGMYRKVSFPRTEQNGAWGF